MTLIEIWAKKIEAKRKAKQANNEEEHKKQQILWNARKEELLGWSKKFVETKREEFKTKLKPLFEVGNKALTNWYAYSDGWEGSVSSLQSHTPYKGPVEVKIKEVVIDASELAEKFYNMIDYNQQDLLMKSYEEYEKFANKKMESWDYQTIWWAYVIKVVGDDKDYWKYTWRENKLLPLTTAEAKYSIKAWKNEVKLNKLLEEKKSLEKKLRAQVEKANHVKVKYIN